MNIHFNFYHFVVNFFREGILRPLTTQNQKIVLIVAAALGGLAACYAACRYCLKNRSFHVLGKKVDFNKDQKTEASSKEKKTFVSHLPNLLSFGKVRQGTGAGDPPSFMGTQFFGKDTVIDNNDKLWSAAFACCFHTTESYQEIMQMIRNIRSKQDVFHAGKPKYYAESCTTLYNNLVRLHDALPGQAKAKEAKLYWNTPSEEVLLPYLLMNEKVDIHNLLFAITPGESVISSFQAPQMDFSYQLQFVGLEKDKIFLTLEKEIEVLSQEVLGENILEAVKMTVKNLKQKESNSLLADAVAFSYLNHLKNSPLELKQYK